MSEDPLMSLLKKKLAVKSHSIELKELQNPLLKVPSQASPKIYDPYAYPPDLKMAKEHGQARRVAIPLHLYEELLGQESAITQAQTVDVCDCCGFPIENKPLEICTSYHNLFFLGSGYPMFFQFVLFAIGLQMLIFIISGIFNIITNLEIDGCNIQDFPLYLFDRQCIPTWWTRISLVSKSEKDPYETSQEITNLITVVVCICFLQWCRLIQRREAFRCDVKLITASDYSIEVTGLPIDCKLSEIRKFFESLEELMGMKVNIVKINRSFYISDFVECNGKMEGFINEKTQYEQYISLSQQDPNSFTKTELYKRKLIELEEKIKVAVENVKFQKTSLKEKCKFTGIAYITLETPEEARMIKKLFERTIWDTIYIYLKKSVKIESKLLFRGNILTVTRAPEPDDILWENLGVSTDVKLKKQLMTTFATFIILVMSFVIILIISYFQTFMQRNATLTGLTLTFVNSCGACLIVIINYCLNFSIERFTRLEKHSTSTNYNSALAEKKIVAVFLNTAIIYILISLYFQNFVGKNGLVENLLYIYFSNMSLTILLQFFDPFYVLRLWNRRSLEKMPEKSGLTQSQANSLYEGPTQNVPFLFSSIVNMLLFTSFYGSLVPFGAIIGMISLVSWYWTYKYLLLRRSSVPSLLGKTMAYEMIEYAEFAPFLFALGDIIFVKIFYDEVKTINLIALGLSCINFILPMKLINKRILKVPEKKDFYKTNEDYKLKYHEIRREIPEEYDRCNPATKRKATEEWVNFIENRTKPKKMLLLAKGEPVNNEHEEEEDEIDLGDIEEAIVKKKDEKKKDVKEIFGGLFKNKKVIAEKVVL